VGGPTPGHDDPSVIDLHALDPNRVRHADTAGIVFVDAYIGDTYGLFARSARIPGLSKSMLKADREDVCQGSRAAESSTGSSRCATATGKA